MNISLDNIEYGNPCLDDYRILLLQCYLDPLVKQLRELYPPPQNSSAATKHELNQLVQYAVTEHNNQHKVVFDKELLSYIQQLFIQGGADPEYIYQVTQDIVDDVMPVVLKLKYHFQRPRPYQLARIYRLELFPSFSHFVNSPSYPSTHVTLASVLCEVLGNVFPTTYQSMKKLVTDVAESRLYMGVHYPSDNTTALLLAEKIVANKEFMKKYGL